MFEFLKRSMESDIEKIALPLILKTGETNRFLREDCNQSLDKMVENVSPARAIVVITAEPLNNKSPVIRTTVSRLLAYITDKIGPNKALSGSKDITDRLLPAVAKLAQDGSLEARIYAKMTLKILMEHEDFERILKKNVTANTMRRRRKKKRRRNKKFLSLCLTTSIQFLSMFTMNHSIRVIASIPSLMIAS